MMFNFDCDPEDPVRAKLDNLATLADFASGRRDAPAFPVHLFLEATNVCNLKCIMCCVFSISNPRRMNAIGAIERGSFDYPRHAEALAPLLRRALVVHCFGFGEPTLNPDFLALLDACATHACMVDFFTNGTSLTPDFCDALVARRVWKVTVSLSGVTREDYETVYRGGRFAPLIDGLRHLDAAKKRAGASYPRVVINSLAFTHHVETFDSFCALMAGCGVNAICLRPLQTYGEGSPAPLPILQRLAAIYRPWVDAPILDRARRIADSFGIELEDESYRADGVMDEASYQARLAERERYLANCAPEQAAVHRIEDVTTFLAARQPSPAARPVSSRRRSVLPADHLTQAEARTILGIKSLPWPEPERPFFCLEPFTTCYVHRDGTVKPCCFATDDVIKLGDLAVTDGAAIWNGPGFQAIRSGIGHGLYPAPACEACVAGRLGPRSWDLELAGYLDWLDRPEVAPALTGPLERMSGLSNADLIDGHFHARTDPFLFGDEADILAGLGPEDFEGYLDMIRDGVLFGWLWSPRAPQLRHRVEAVVNGRVVGCGRAGSESRRDLVAAGKGDGRYGFAFPLAAMPDSGGEILLRLAARPELVPLHRSGLV